MNSDIKEHECYELRITKFETARQEAMEDYFSARPQLSRTRKEECIFEGGFRMAWDLLSKAINAQCGQRG